MDVAATEPRWRTIQPTRRARDEHLNLRQPMTPPATRALPTAIHHRFALATALGLALLVVLGYRATLGLGFLADDFVLWTQTHARTLSPALLAVDREWVFHRPLVILVWSALGRLGAGAVQHHVLSLILHWLNSLLVVALTWRLAPANRRVAVAAGVLFALLPLHVEAVAWPSSLYDLFATLFYVLALLLLLRFWRDGRARAYVAALVTYQLCLWSKELAFTWPLAAVLTAAVWPGRPRWRSVAAALLPFAGLLALALAQRLAAWGDLGGYREAPRDYPSFIWDRLASAFATLLAPLSRILWPEPAVQAWWLAAAALVLIGLVYLRERRLLAFAVGWVVITAVPVLNLLPLGSGLESGRLLYLPAVGAGIGLAALLDGVAGAAEQAWPALRRGVAFPALVSALALLYLGALQLHFQPWAVASRVAADLPAQLHRLVSRFGPDSHVQAIGLPRLYRGAQLFNLGFDHAYQQRSGSWFQLHQRAATPVMAAALDADWYQMAVTEDVERANWRLSELLAVVRPNTDVGATGEVVAAWEPGDCAGWSEWAVLGADTTCAPGRGLNVRPTGSDPGIVSPALDVPAGQWLRIAVDMWAAGSGTGGSNMQVFWHSPQDWFGEDRSKVIRLRPGPEVRRYILFVPPDDPSGAPNQIRIDPIDREWPVRVERVEVRAIAP